jgi:signal transduction histidine kinase
MKLFYHLFGYLLFGMIVLVGIDEYISYVTEVNQFEEDIVTNSVQVGKSIAGMIVHVWNESGEKKALELLQDASAAGKLKSRWVWLDELQENDFFRQQDVDLDATLKAGKPVSIKHVSRNGCAVHNTKGTCTYIYTYVPVELGKGRKGAIEISQPLHALEKFKRQMLYRCVLISIVLALFFGVILYLFVARKIGRPIRRLMNHADRVGKGDFTLEANIVGDDELAELSQTMNDMCSRLLIFKEKIRLEYEARLHTVEQLRHTERLSSLGVLSAGIAHELGTPLNVMSGRAKMIMQEDLSLEEMRKNGGIIYSQCDRMAQVIRQLLDYSRRPNQKVENIKIDFLLKQVVQLLYPMSKKQQISIEFAVAQDAQTVICADQEQIQQVFVNLLMNAIQAMVDGGVIHITLDNKVLESTTPVEKQKYLTVQVVDQGGGIMAENMEEIFTPFFTTKNMGVGTGLGLSIAHEVIEEHHGWITVENVQNGSCFTVYLPIGEHKKCVEKFVS